MSALAPPITQQEAAIAAAGSSGPVAAPPDGSAFRPETATVECSATNPLAGSSKSTTTG